MREIKASKDSPNRHSARRLAQLSLRDLRRKKTRIQAAISFHKQSRLFQNVPIDVFSTSLSPAEALVKWLKENHKLSITKIARILNRDPRAIWITYQNARAKYPALLSPVQEIKIPISLFKDRTRSILEHLVLYAKIEQRLSLTKISSLLGKHHSTVSTAYVRGRRKRS